MSLLVDNSKLFWWVTAAGEKKRAKCFGLLKTFVCPGSPNHESSQTAAEALHLKAIRGNMMMLYMWQMRKVGRCEGYRTVNWSKTGWNLPLIQRRGKLVQHLPSLDLVQFNEWNSPTLEYGCPEFHRGRAPAASGEVSLNTISSCICPIPLLLTDVVTCF